MFSTSVSSLYSIKTMYNRPGIFNCLESKNIAHQIITQRNMGMYCGISVGINNHLKCIYFTSHRWYTCVVHTGCTYRCWYSRGELSFLLTILLVSFIFEIFWYTTAVDEWLSWDLLWSHETDQTDTQRKNVSH
jgi:hypothetical protein